MDILDKQYEARKKKAFMQLVAQHKEQKKKEQLLELKRSGKIKKM